MNMTLDTRVKLAIRSGNLDNLKSLGDNIHGLDYRHENAVYLAVDERKHDVLQWLLREGVKPNVANYNGFVPLQQAIVNSDILAVKILLQYVDVNTKFVMDNNTPLIHSVLYGSSNEIIKYLLDCGADLHYHNAFGDSAFLCACEEADWYAIDIFIKKDPNIVNDTNVRTGRSCLHIAIKDCHVLLMEKLISYGAEIHAKDAYGVSVVDIFHSEFDVQGYGLDKIL